MSELGLYYYRARFYDPVTGSFVSQDPIGFAAGDANLQRYVGNNSLTFTDPTGNAAVAGRLTAQKLSDLGIAAATGFAGFAVGFTCGVLDAYFTHDPENGPFSFADASGDIFKQAVLGGIVGAGIGALGAAAGAAAPLFGGLFTTIGYSLQVVNLASSPTAGVFVLRASCFIAETVTFFLRRPEFLASDCGEPSPLSIAVTSQFNISVKVG